MERKSKTRITNKMTAVKRNNTNSVSRYNNSIINTSRGSY